MTHDPAATIPRRFSAFALDYLVLSIYIAVLSGVFALAPRAFVAELFATPLKAQAAGFATLTLPVWLYFALTECSSRRATVGKRALGLTVTDINGNRISIGRSLTRSGLKLVPWELAHTCLWRIEGWPTPEEPPTGWPLAGLIAVWIIVGAYLVSMLTSPHRQTLYDRIAGTVVSRRAAVE